MELSKKELLNKFPQLRKFETQKWLVEETINADCNYKKIPLMATFELIKELILFVDTLKMKNIGREYNECLSIQLRLKQIKSLLEYFCEDTLTEKTLKGENIT